MSKVDLGELRYELDELRRDLDEVELDRLQGRIESLILVAVEALEALQVEAGEPIARRWQMVDVEG